MISRRIVFAIILIVLLGAGSASYFVYANSFYRSSPSLTCSEGTVVTGDTSWGGAMAYDPANGLIYIGVGSGLAVINASTNAIVQNISVGFVLETVGYDPANNLVCIGGQEMFRNSVLNPASDMLTSLAYNATVPDQYSSYIPSEGVFYVPIIPFDYAEVNATSDGLVSYTNLNQTIWESAYDNVTGLVYFADNGRDSVLAVMSSTNEIVHNISMGYRAGPSSLVVDPANGYLYVSDYGNINALSVGVNTLEMGNVTVINPKTNEIVKTINGVGLSPNFFVYAQSTQDVYFVVAQSSNFVDRTASSVPPAQVRGIDYKTDSIVYNATLGTNATTYNPPTGMIYDPVNSCLYVARWNEVIAVPTTGS